MLQNSKLHPSGCCTLVVVEERPPHMIVKRFGCTTIHNKALYKCLIHSFIPHSMDESGQEHQEAFKELRTVTDLALHATKSNGAGNRQDHGQFGGAGVPPMVKPHGDQSHRRVCSAPLWTGLQRGFRRLRRRRRRCVTFSPSALGTRLRAARRIPATQPAKPVQPQPQ